jgi:DNA-binding transcriptional ArsR family regulator
MSRTVKPPVTLYSALADATRCRILEMLKPGPVPVHTLADAFAISRPAISRHLRVLKEAGLVGEVKKGRENYYALRADKLTKATGWIAALQAEEKPQPKPAKAKVVQVAPTPEALFPPATPKPAISQMGFDF